MLRYGILRILLILVGAVALLLLLLTLLEIDSPELPLLLAFAAFTLGIVGIDLARRFIHKSLTSTLDEMLDYEGVASTLSAATRDAREGTQSFLEKRKPEFKGY